MIKTKCITFLVRNTEFTVRTNEIYFSNTSIDLNVCKELLRCPIDYRGSVTISSRYLYNVLMVLNEIEHIMMVNHRLVRPVSHVTNHKSIHKLRTCKWDPCTLCRYGNHIFVYRTNYSYFQKR